MARLLWGRVLAAAWLLTAACGSDDDHGSVLVKGRACRTLAECSITNDTCQNAILDITACVRGDATPPLPPIRTLTRDELRQELSDQAAASAEMADESQQVAGASFEKTLEALHLVTSQGTLSEAAVDEQAGSIAAFYREDEKDVTVIADTTMNLSAAMNELAHEFTHYLQDTAGELAMAHKSGVSIDESVSRRALAEGEAVVNSYRASAQMLGYSPLDILWTDLFNNIESNIAKATNSSKSPFLAALSQLPYVISPPVIEDLWEAGTRTRVDALFTDPPLTQIDWINGNAGSAASLVEELDCYPPLPPDGYELAGIDTLGALGLYAMLGTQNMASLASAKVWRGDALAVYSALDSDPNDPVVLAVWRVRFTDTAAATRFASLISPLQLAVTRFGRELTISVSSQPDQAPLDVQARVSCPSAQQLAATYSGPGSMHSAASRWLESFRARRLCGRAQGC